jgi:hypothetical protein
MRQALLITLLCLITVPVLGQAEACEVNLKINGVAVGSSYATVIRRLGTPLHQKKEKVSASISCSGEAETHITIKYSGLEIVCIRYATERVATVTSIELTSPKWQIHPEVKIGLTRQQLESRLGKRGHYENQALFYCMKNTVGTVKFAFEKDKLIKISLSETRC